MDWIPKTKLGQKVSQGIIGLDEIFITGRKIKEPEIVDKLIPNLQNEIIFIGGTPGKGGGIRRTPMRRTVRMHRSGRRYRLSSLAVIGNGDGYIGAGKSVGLEYRETIEKSILSAKLNIFPVKRGCGSWECTCGERHTIPVQVTGKSGSVRVKLWPAPKGIGLAVPDEAKKIFRLAGIKDIWSKRYGESRSRVNYAYAIIDALKKINLMKLDLDDKIRERESPIQEEQIEKAEEKTPIEENSAATEDPETAPPIETENLKEEKTEKRKLANKEGKTPLRKPVKEESKRKGSEEQ